MYRYVIELRAANPKAPFDFEKGEERKHVEQAIRITNTSASFRKEKRITIKEILPEAIVIELGSQNPLENPIMSLKGVSRWLVATGQFNNHIYRRSLFSGVVRENGRDETEKLSDLEVANEFLRIMFATEAGDKQIKRQLIETVTKHKNNRL